MYTEPICELVIGALTDTEPLPICCSICRAGKALTRTTKGKFIKLLHVKFHLSERTSLVNTYQLSYLSLIATVNLLISDGRHSFGK